MTHRSILLKIISIIMLIVAIAASALLALLFIHTSDLLTQIGYAWDSAEAAMITGYSWFFPIAILTALLAGALEVIAAIIGLACKNKIVIIVFGIIALAVRLTALVLTYTAGLFTVWNISPFVLPILYIIGAVKCR